MKNPFKKLSKLRGKKRYIVFGLIAVEMLSLPAAAQIVHRVAFDIRPVVIAVEIPTAETGISRFLVTSNAGFGVKASVIQPGNYRSDISKSNRDRRGELTEAQKNSPYADIYKGRLEGPVDRAEYKEPDEVTAAIRHALFDPNPRIRYMVVPNTREADITIRRTLQRAAQRNEGQEHAFSREELIAMLDAAIAKENATAEE